MRTLLLQTLVLAFLSVNAYAQSKISGDQPIEIVSDTLEVLQNDNKAIFRGNVIATQGTTNMRSDVMTVYYRNEGGDDADGAMGKGIYRIDADGGVIYTTPTETAKGDHSIYDVDNETLDLTGNVLLTRGQNVLKGTKVVYNLKTGRSVLTSGGGGVTSGGRVRGLFVPGSEQGAGQ